VTSWFVAVNAFVDPAQLTSPKRSQKGHLDLIRDATDRFVMLSADRVPTRHQPRVLSRRS
jgi:hypothetical protein